MRVLVYALLNGDREAVALAVSLLSGKSVSTDADE